MDDAATPYMRALTCKVAYDDMVGRFQSMGSLPETQRRALQMAGTALDKRLASFAKSSGKSDADVREDARARAIALADPALNGRIVVGCLRKMQQGAQF